MTISHSISRLNYSCSFLFRGSVEKVISVRQEFQNNFNAGVFFLQGAGRNQFLAVIWSRDFVRRSSLSQLSSQQSLLWTDKSRLNRPGRPYRLAPDSSWRQKRTWISTARAVTNWIFKGKVQDWTFWTMTFGPLLHQATIAWVYRSICRYSNFCFDFEGKRPLLRHLFCPLQRFLSFVLHGKTLHWENYSSCNCWKETQQDVLHDLRIEVSHARNTWLLTNHMETFFTAK